MVRGCALVQNYDIPTTYYGHLKLSIWRLTDQLPLPLLRLESNIVMVMVMEFSSVFLPSSVHNDLILVGSQWQKLLKRITQNKCSMLESAWFARYFGLLTERALPNTKCLIWYMTIPKTTMPNTLMENNSGWRSQNDLNVLNNSGGLMPL